MGISRGKMRMMRWGKEVCMTERMRMCAVRIVGVRNVFGRRHMGCKARWECEPSVRIGHHDSAWDLLWHIWLRHWRAIFGGRPLRCGRRVTPGRIRSGFLSGRGVCVCTCRIARCLSVLSVVCPLPLRVRSSSDCGGSSCSTNVESRMVTKVKHRIRRDSHPWREHICSSRWEIRIVTDYSLRGYLGVWIVGIAVSDKVWVVWIVCGHRNIRRNGSRYRMLAKNGYGGRCIRRCSVRRRGWSAIASATSGAAMGWGRRSAWLESGRGRSIR